MDAQPPATFIERQLQRVLSGSRWLMAPIYVGLAACLLLILAAFAFKAVKLCAANLTQQRRADHRILSLIDLSLVANLILIVVWAGLRELRLPARQRALSEPARNGSGTPATANLKLKLITSIVAITAIHLLEDFMNLGC